MWKYAVAATLAASLLILPACAPKLDPQESCNFVQNGSLQRVSWKKGLPVRLYIHESVASQEYINAIHQAAEEWNLTMGMQAIVIEASKVGGPNVAKKDGYSMIYMQNTWDADKPTEQARTTIYWTGSRITEADVRINAKNFKFFTGTEPNHSAVHLPSLMVHELGHVLGLAHRAEHGSVMVTTLFSGEIRPRDGQIPEIDKESLRCEYN